MRKGNNNFKRRISKFLAAVMTVGVMAGCNVGVLTPKAASTAQNLVGVAGREVGYHEKASNSNLDDKTANSGSDMHGVHTLYGGVCRPQGFRQTGIRRQDGFQVLQAGTVQEDSTGREEHIFQSRAM